MDRIQEILALLANSAGIPAAQLTELRAELATFIRATPESITQEHVAALTTAMEGVTAIDAEVSGRAEREAAVTALQSQLTDPPVVEVPAVVEPATPAPVVEAPAVPAVVEAPPVAPVEVPVPVAAAAPAPAAIQPPVPAPTPPRRMTLVASVGSPNSPAGTRHESLASAGMALISAAENMGRGPDGEKVNVLRHVYQDLFTPERRLTQDAVENGRKMANLINPLIAAVGIEEFEELRARTASGGFCAPLDPDRNFIRISQDGTPTIDSLVGVNGARGGHRFNLPVPFTDFAGAVGIWTEANDIAAEPPSETPRKTCLRVECPEDDEVRVEAIYRCLEWGNLDARTYPERVADVMAKSLDYMARVRENQVLAAMEANSTNQTFGPVLGAARDIIYALALYCESFRQRHRTGRYMVMQAWAPFWVETMMALDLMRQLPGDGTFSGARAEVRARLREENISMTYYDDGTVGNNFNAFAEGALENFPNPVEILVAHPGAHVFVDSGELDLGIVRDSVLNARNDFQVFNEVFQGVASPGFDPAVLTLSVCADGTTSAAVDVAACGDNPGS